MSEQMKVKEMPRSKNCISGLCLSCENLTTIGHVFFCKASITSYISSNTSINNREQIKTTVAWPGEFERLYPSELFVCVKCKFH